jgi:hypothetical protein
MPEGYKCSKGKVPEGYNTNMNMPKMPAPIVVESEESFNRMLTDLTKPPAIAVDTESNSLHAYQNGSA